MKQYTTLNDSFQDNLRKDLAKIRIPTLVTTGSDDLVTSAQGKIYHVS